VDIYFWAEEELCVDFIPGCVGVLKPSELCRRRHRCRGMSVEMSIFDHVICRLAH